MSRSSVQTGLSAEGRLVLLTAGGAELDPAIRETVAEPINWARLIRIAEAERAEAIVWKRLMDVAPDMVPADVRLPFERIAMVAEFKALHLRQRLEETVAALQRDGIEVMLLKGAGLALTAYESFAERPMGDLDLLVDPARAADAQRLAKEAGWMADEVNYPSTHYAGHHHLPPLRDAYRTGVRLELHTALFIDGHPFSLTRAQLLKESQRVAIGSGHAQVPSAAHALLHLSVHYAWSHMLQFGTWRTIRDVAALGRTGRVNWDAVPALAQEHRAGTCVYWTLRLCSQLADVPVPPEVLAALTPPQAESVLRGLERHLRVQCLPWDSYCPSERVQRLMWNLAVLPWRSGHGRVRPWDHNEVLPGESRQGPVSLGRRLRQQASNLGVWGRYLRLLVNV